MTILDENQECHKNYYIFILLLIHFQSLNLLESLTCQILTGKVCKLCAAKPDIGIWICVQWL